MDEKAQGQWVILAGCWQCFVIGSETDRKSISPVRKLPRVSKGSCWEKAKEETEQELVSNPGLPWNGRKKW